MSCMLMQLQLVKVGGACLTSSGAARHLSNVLGQDQSIVLDIPPALLGIQSWSFVHCRCVAGLLCYSCLHSLDGVFSGYFNLSLVIPHLDGVWDGQKAAVE